MTFVTILLLSGTRSSSHAIPSTAIEQTSPSEPILLLILF
jgi:hypothetical protein